jgi:hypothetical protein
MAVPGGRISSDSSRMIVKREEARGKAAKDFLLPPKKKSRERATPLALQIHERHWSGALQ